MMSWRQLIRVRLVRDAVRERHIFRSGQRHCETFLFGRASPVGQGSTMSAGWVSAASKRQVRFRVDSKGRLPALGADARDDAASARMSRKGWDRPFAAPGTDGRLAQ